MNKQLRVQVLQASQTLNRDEGHRGLCEAAVAKIEQGPKVRPEQLLHYVPKFALLTILDAFRDALAPMKYFVKIVLVEHLCHLLPRLLELYCELLFGLETGSLEDLGGLSLMDLVEELVFPICYLDFHCEKLKGVGEPKWKAL